MTITLITIFIVSLVALLAMLFRKASLVERGYYEGVEPVRRELIPDVTLAKVRDNSVQYAKRGGHVVIMTVIKTWVVASHISGKKLKEKMPHIFDKSQRSVDRKNVFSTVKNIARKYNSKAQKLRQRIKEQDVVEGSSEGESL